MRRFLLQLVLGILDSVEIFFRKAVKVLGVILGRTLVEDEDARLVSFVVLILYYMIGSAFADALEFSGQGWLFFACAPLLLLIGIGLVSGFTAVIGMHIMYARQTLRSELDGSDPKRAFTEASLLAKRLPCNQEVLGALTRCQGEGVIVPDTVQKSIRLSEGVAYLCGKQEGRVLGNLRPLSEEEIIGELRLILSNPIS